MVPESILRYYHNSEALKDFFCHYSRKTVVVVIVVVITFSIHNLLLDVSGTSVRDGGARQDAYKVK